MKESLKQWQTLKIEHLQMFYDTKVVKKDIAPNILRENLTIFVGVIENNAPEMGSKPNDNSC